jgi:hypothetical protein
MVRTSATGGRGVGGFAQKKVDGLAAVLLGAGRCLRQVSRSRGHEHVTQHCNYRQLCGLGCANESHAGLVQSAGTQGNTLAGCLWQQPDDPQRVVAEPAGAECPGRARVSPPPPPLRTVLETFTSHGSSKSLTARILKIISRGVFLDRSKLAFGFLLVAVQMYQFPVAPRVRAVPGSWYFVMTMKLLAVEEIHATESTDPALVVGHVDVPGAQVFRVHLLPFPPVIPEIRVVGGGSASHQCVSFDPEPGEFEEVFSGALVAKHPVVVPLRVPAASTRGRGSGVTSSPQLRPRKPWTPRC